MQSSTIEFLSTPQAYGLNGEAVEVITTHISHIFLIGRKAYKLKRAVTLPYLDFSTLEDRRKACENEVILNRRTAPNIYIGTKPVTRDQQGKLKIGGDGEVVEWLVEMTRFGSDHLLVHCAEKGELTGELMENLAAKIFDFHARAKVYQPVQYAMAMKNIIDNNAECFASFGADELNLEQISDLNAKSEEKWWQVAELLNRRGQEGLVRHCHGDLHLGNIVLIDGVPVLFDAIEFNDDFAIIDVIYDLAFLVMDLIHQDLPNEANILINRYLALSSDYDSLAALPLFLSMRAAIRSHVAALANEHQVAREYLELAIDFLRPSTPRLIAVGGLSGTGKSTLARAITPEIGVSPGAVILRSDVIRKQIAGVDQHTKLTADGYTPEMTRRTYDQMYADARTALRAGHSVVVDAVFAQEAERAALQRLAQKENIRFDGIWLSVEPLVAEERIGQRVKDASDATVEVLQQQLEYDLGNIDWSIVESSKNLPDVVESVRQKLR